MNNDIILIRVHQHEHVNQTHFLFLKTSVKTKQMAAPVNTIVPNRVYTTTTAIWIKFDSIQEGVPSGGMPSV